MLHWNPWGMRGRKKCKKSYLLSFTNAGSMISGWQRRIAEKRSWKKTTSTSYSRLSVRFVGLHSLFPSLWFSLMSGGVWGVEKGWDRKREGKGEGGCWWLKAAPGSIHMQMAQGASTNPWEERRRTRTPSTLLHQSLCCLWERHESLLCVNTFVFTLKYKYNMQKVKGCGLCDRWRGGLNCPAACLPSHARGYTVKGCP